MSGSGRVEVSVIMPNFNCGMHIRAAICSALEQTVGPLEVVVVDDASTDNSAEQVQQLAAQWPDRVKLFVQAHNKGSAAARNRAMLEAKGRWLAVLDSDDLMHPDRLRRLIALADDLGADLIADDMLTFYEEGRILPHRLLSGLHARRAQWVGLADFVLYNRFHSRRAPLGYLKPVIRAESWRRTNVWYDEKLRLAQDYDFALRLLEKGCRYYLHPEPLYFYRKHSRSNSHQIKPGHLAPLIQADREFEQRISPGAGEAELRKVVRKRRRSLLDADSFNALVAGIKASELRAVASAAWARPMALLLLRFPVGAVLQRLFCRPTMPEQVASACLICGADEFARASSGITFLAQRLRSEGLEVRLIVAGVGANSVPGWIRRVHGIDLTSPVYRVASWRGKRIVFSKLQSLRGGRGLGSQYVGLARALQDATGPVIVSPTIDGFDSVCSLRPHAARVAYWLNAGGSRPFPDDEASCWADLVLTEESGAGTRTKFVCLFDQQLAARLAEQVDPATRVMVEPRLQLNARSDLRV